MKKIILALVMMLFATQTWAADVRNLSADSALNKLKFGNERFAQFKMKHPNMDKARRERLVVMQRPFAVVLACSDSRVAPELIFDQGLGDLFVIRNAGNVIDQDVIGSIEYAVHHLGVNLVVILGHESCGAVGAAMKEEKDSPAIEGIKEAIRPACTECLKENKYTYTEVVKTHAKQDVKSILEDKDLYEYAQKNNVKIIPAYYNLRTGVVEFLD